MKRRIARPITRVLFLLTLATPLALTGCEDAFEPAVWGNFPDTVDLYSLARGEYVDRPGAYDFLLLGGLPVVVESLKRDPFSFDIAVTEDEEGNFLLLPTGFFPEANVRPGILADSTASFDGLARAPREGYITTEPVPADTTVVYVVRSRVARACLRYAKMEILALRPDGVMTIRTLVNPNCGDRNLVPTAPVEIDEGTGGT